MHSMIRWSPLDEALSLRQAMDRMFEETFVRPSLRNGGAEGTRAAGLPIDLYETDDALILKARLPGMNPEDVEISVNGDNLVIKAELGSDATLDDAADWTWYRHELFHGAMTRSITLHTVVEADEAEATFRNGELTLELPKAEEARPRSIKVKSVG